MKSIPWASPWDIHKVRMELRERRYRFLLRFEGKPSPMSMRHFDRNMNRFVQNWKQK